MRTATRADITGMVDVLAGAFAYDDPIDEYIFPDEAVRRRRAPRMLRAMITHRFLPAGGAEVAVLDEQVVGALLWYPRGYRPGGWREMIAGPQLLAAMGPAVRRGIEVDAAMDRAAPADPHFFHVYLGTDPTLQRSGVGRALYASFTERADREGAAICGICKDANVGYYQALGNERVGAVRLGSAGPELNVIVRRPRQN
ncbi:GNAT family N-acetyltransferase [Nocardia sp. AG03]|uniref:GNAT family N-acetyltransferase n=1 Tax=Nocardia sp. AG03 TaxID=3025312 RepID=UPI00241897E6|nr:GNAT family N-acetyltransferase [Nocardia sp. AG03]